MQVSGGHLFDTGSTVSTPLFLFSDEGNKNADKSG